MIPDLVIPAPLVVTLEDYKKFTWDDLDYDDEGGVIGVAGILWTNIKDRELRALSSSLGLSKGIRGCKKMDMIQRIVAEAQKKAQYNALRLGEDTDDDDDQEPAAGAGVGGGGVAADEKTRKEAQCPFRLLNILFSDKFAAAFAATGNTANRQLLDSGKAGNEQYFWVEIQKEFVCEASNHLYAFLDFQDEEVFCDMGHLDLTRIVHHDWKKLRKIWKDLHRDYKKGMGKYTQSGTHNSNFFRFCDNKVDVFYLWRKLKLRPELSEFVRATLPDGCAIASNQVMNVDTSDVDEISPMSSAASKRKQKQSAITAVGTQFASALNKIGDSLSTTNPTNSISQQQQDLLGLKSALFHQKNDRDVLKNDRDVKRLKMEEDRFKMEEERLHDEKDREDTRLGLEKKKVELEERKADLLEWEKVLQGIKDLRAELSSPNLRETDKASIYAEIDDLTEYRALLLAKKKKLYADTAH